MEENATLFDEADMLGSILGDLEGDIEGAQSQRKLIDTPARAMLERDLRKMLSTLKFSLGSANSGPSPSSLSAKERKVLDYLQATSGAPGPRPDSSQRPFTPRSRPASSWRLQIRE